MVSRNSRAVSWPPSAISPMLSPLGACHSPWILLIPEARHVEVRNGRGLELPDPGLPAPEVVVVRVGDDVVPVGDGPMEVPGVDVRDGAEREVPGIGVVDLECEVGVLELVG